MRLLSSQKHYGDTTHRLKMTVKQKNYLTTSTDKVIPTLQLIGKCCIVIWM